MTNKQAINRPTKLIRFTLVLASMLTVMSGAIVAAALPEITKTFGASNNAEFYSKLILTIPALVIAFVSPVIGWVIDRVNKKLIFICAVCLYVLAGTSGAFSESLLSILAGRIFLGIGVAGILITVNTFIAEAFIPSERTGFLSVQAAAISFGGIVFISTGGFLAEISWRGPFYVYAAGLPVLMLALIAFKNYSAQPAGQQSQQPAAYPVPWKPIAVVFGLMLLAMIIFYMVPVQLPYILANSFSVSNGTIGLIVSASTVGSVVSSLLFPRARKIFSTAKVYALAFFLIGIGYTIVFIVKDVALLIIGVVINGLGNGFIQPNTSQRIMELAPAESRGKIMGWLSSIIFIGQFLSPLLIQPLNAAFGLKTVFGLVGLAIITAVIVINLVVMSSKNRGAVTLAGNQATPLDQQH